MAPAAERTRFQTLATLDIKPISRPYHVAWHPKVVAVFLLVFLAAVLYEFFADASFFVQRVDVQGLSSLTQPEVERITGAMGYSIYFLEPGQIERSVGRIAEVRVAHVLLGVPNLVLVQVDERVPVSVWFKGDDAYWVDVDGIAFKARSLRPDLPTVRDFDPTGLQAGKHVALAPFNAFRAVRAAWPQSPKNFEWTSSNGLTAIDEHGWKIIFGDASEMDLKITRLKALMPRLVALGKHIKFIDLGKGDPFYQ